MTASDRIATLRAAISACGCRRDTDRLRMCWWCWSRWEELVELGAEPEATEDRNDQMQPRRLTAG